MAPKGHSAATDLVDMHDDGCCCAECYAGTLSCPACGRVLHALAPLSSQDAAVALCGCEASAYEEDPLADARDVERECSVWRLG